MAYRYHNQKLRYSVEKMIRELQKTCDGRNLSIAEITKNEEGQYSEELFLKFLDELVEAGYSEAEYYDQSLTPEFEHRKEYLKTLLYVLIRSMQAKIGYFTCDYGQIPLTKDTFDDLLYGINAGGWPIRFSMPGFQISKDHLVSSSLEATARSVYNYLSGEDLAFPDPYLMKKALENAASTEESTADSAEEKSAQNASADSATTQPTEEIVQEDDVDVDELERLATEEIDDGDYFIYDDDEEITDEEYHQTVIAALNEEERNRFIYSDAQSEDDYRIDEQEEWEEESRIRKFHINNHDDRDELFKKEQRRLKIFFPYASKYIEMYKKLIEITQVGDEKHLDDLEHFIDEWLRQNDYTVYSDEETCNNVFDMIYAATKEVVLWQGKK